MATRSAALDLSPLQGFGIDLTQYFGLWSIEPQRGLGLWESVCRLNIAAHVAANADRRVDVVAVDLFDGISGIALDAKAAAAAAAKKAIERNPTVAVVSLEGALTKRGSSLSDAGSMIRARQEIRAAASSGAIDAILLRLDSPGGTVAGTADLADEVAAAAQQKPLAAFVEDLGASAAYWIASQAPRIIANSPNALIGSIGTLMGFYDLSGLAGQEGVKPVVISTGGMKGLGFPGTEVTSEQKAYLQEIVDRTQTGFTAAVARGRKMAVERAQTLADGKVHLATAAQALGLIDGIQSFDATLRQLAAEARTRKPTSTTRGKTMSESTDPKPATIAELKSACPKAEPNWLLEQLEKGATLDAACKSYRENLEAQLAIRDEENKKLSSQLDAAGKSGASAPKKPGVAALGNGGKVGTESSSGGSAVEEFDAAVAAKVKAGLPKHAAIARVVRENKDLHQRYLAEVNAAGRAAV